MNFNSLIGSVRKMLNLQEYDQSITKLEEITPAAALEKFKANAGEIVFIGRPNCPYCRKFLPKLLDVVEQNSLNVLYLNSSDSSDKNLIDFRNSTGVVTVPSLVRVGGENQFKNLGLESSATVEEIQAAIANS